LLFSTLLISAAVGLFVDQDTRTPRPRSRRQIRQLVKQQTQVAQQSLEHRVIGKVGTSEIIAVEEKKTEVVAKVKTHLRAATAVGSCIAIGTVFPVAVVAVPGIVVWATMPVVRSAAEYWKKNGRPDVYTLSASRFGMLLASQSFFSLFFGMLMRWAHGTLYLQTKDRSRRIISELFGKQAETAWLVTDSGEVNVPIGDLKVGDVVAVQAGDLLPVDGRVVSGAARVDQQMLTGEERPVELFPGEIAFAGTQLVSGRVFIKAERTGAETTAGRIVSVLNQTTEYRLTTEIQAKRIADRSAPYHLGIGALALPFIGLYRTAGLLLALPTAEVLLFTGPIGMLGTLARAAEHGIAIMDGRTLEMLPEVDTVVFDKTGTLTLPVPVVDHVVTEDGIAENDLIVWAAAAEHRQTHPVALAIREEATRRSLDLHEPEEADYSPSNGIQARILGKLILVGSGRYMEMMDVGISDRARAAADQARADGRPFVYVACDGQIAGTIVLRTSLRPEARDVVKALQERGLHVRILSGDGKAQTEAAARELGVDGYDAEVLPQEKAYVVQRLREEGRFVCFVGDGINDLVAMRAAQVSIAVAGATTAANAVAGIMIYDGDLKHVVHTLKIGDLFRQRLSESIMVSFIPDSVSVGLILFGGAGFMTAVVLGWFSVGSALATILRPWPEELQPHGRKTASSLLKMLPTSRRQITAAAHRQASQAARVIEGSAIAPAK
jgi:heavy metal translocating P-type ATPase